MNVFKSRDAVAGIPRNDVSIVRCHAADGQVVHVVHFNPVAAVAQRRVTGGVHANVITSSSSEPGTFILPKNNNSAET